MSHANKVKCMCTSVCNVGILPLIVIISASRQVIGMVKKNRNLYPEKIGKNRNLIKKYEKNRNLT